MTSERHGRRIAFALLLVCTSASPLAHAVYWNNDPAFGRTSASGLTDRVQWFENTHVIYNQTNNTRGTATLLDSQWALTVRHVVQNGGDYGQIAPAGQINVNILGVPYYGSQIFTPDGGSEIALVRLATSAAGALDATGILNGSFDEPGRVLQIGGYGLWGVMTTTGAGGTVTGTSNNSIAFHRAYNTGFIAGNGQIQITANGESTLFNNRLVEGLAGSGDSGGPMFGFYGTNFADQSEDRDQWRLVGLTATSSGPTQWGGSSHYTRLAAYHNWLVTTISAQSDFDSNGAINQADWDVFRSFHLSDMTGLTPAQRAARGDLDGDGMNAFSDFRLFQSDFDLRNGDGALAALIASVPEPGTIGLLVIGTALLALKRRTVFGSATRQFQSHLLTALLAIAVALSLKPAATSAAPPGSGWRLIHADEFSGAAVDGVKWDTAYEWGRTHNHDAYALDSNVTVNGGVVTLKATREATNGKPFSSGLLSSHGDFRYTYGYSEMRIKMPSKRGAWPAFWMLDSGWPPEIDIMEYPLFVDGNLNDQYYANSHWSTPAGNASNGQWIDRNVNLGADFHTYGLEWTSTQLKYYFDDQLVKTASNQSQFQNMYTIFNLAVGGWPGSPSLAQWAAGASDTAQADWFRVWQQPAAAADTSWNYSSSGSATWDVDANWTSGRPRYERQRAFFDAQTGRRTMLVTWANSRTLGELHLSGNTAYTLGESGGGIESLMFADAPDGWSLLAVDGGAVSHALNSRLDIWSNLEVRNDGSAPLRLQGDIVGQARPNGASSTGGILLFTGSGQTIVSGNASHQRDTRLESGANVQLTGRLYQENAVHAGAALRISGDSKLRLGNLKDSGVGGASLGYLPQGAGSLVFNAGSVAITEDSQSTRAITIQSGSATVEANAEFQWDDAGPADIVSVDGGNLTLSGVGSGVFNKALGGSGGLIKRGSSGWEVRKANSYSGPTQILEGSLEVTGGIGAGAVTVASGARLSGDGVIAGQMQVYGALAPGAGSSVGALDAASVTLGAGSVLEIELFDLATHDQLNVAGALAIAPGTLLVVSQAAGSPYSPAAGDVITIATAAGGVTGAFSQATLPQLDGFLWNVQVSPTNVSLLLCANPSGDFNADGMIDGTDFLTWQRNVGAAGAQFTDGDANRDGAIDSADLHIWQQQFGAVATSAAAAAVPEPGSATLWIALLVLGRFLGLDAQAKIEWLDESLPWGVSIFAFSRH